MTETHYPEFPHPEFELRPVDGLLLESLWTLIQELAAFGKLPVPGNLELLKKWLLESPAAEALLIFSRDHSNTSKENPVGFLVFFQNFSTFNACPGLYLEDLYVRPEFRSGKIGTAVMQWLARVAVERDYARIDWEALEWNEKALNFYQKSPVNADLHQEWVHCRLEGTKIQQLAESRIF